jgi:hypothetical protein
MIGNAIVDIWIAEGVRSILKYEDDLAIFRLPIPDGRGLHKYTYDRKDVSPDYCPLAPRQRNPHFHWADLETRQVSRSLHDPWLSILFSISGSLSMHAPSGASELSSMVGGLASNLPQIGRFRVGI